MENFRNAVRAECKAAGVMETPENLWDFFIEKVRRLRVSERRDTSFGLTFPKMIFCLQLVTFG